MWVKQTDQTQTEKENTGQNAGHAHLLAQLRSRVNAEISGRRVRIGEKKIAKDSAKPKNLPDRIVVTGPSN